MSTATSTRAADRLLVSLRNETMAGARYALLEELRRHGQAVKVRVGIAVLGHVQASEVLADNERFALPTEEHFDATQPGWRDNDLARLCPELVLLQEGAAHREVRGSMMRAVAEAQSGEFRKRVTEHVSVAVDHLAEQLERHGTVNAVEDFCRPLTAAVTADLFDTDPVSMLSLIPEAELLAKAIDEPLRKLSEPESRAAREVLRHASELSRGSSSLRGLEQVDVVALVNPTLVNLSSAIGNLVHLLASEENVREAALRPSGEEQMTDEVLRYDPPVHGTFRIATRKSELDGVPMSEGDTVLVFTAAANRDPSVWPKAASFLAGRGSCPQSLSFGRGIHACVGKSLARTVLAEVPRLLLSKLAAPTLAAAPTTGRGLLRNYLRDLPIAWRG